CKNIASVEAVDLAIVPANPGFEPRGVFGTGVASITAGVETIMNPIETYMRSRVAPAPLNLKPVTGERVRMWVVDDQEPVRSLMIELLKKFDGLECEQEFSSAEELLDELSPHNTPEVVLMDVQMPGMGGLEAIEKICAVAPETQVIMMTTFYD